LFSSFDQIQKRSVKAILDKWYTTGDDAFIFPIIDGPPGTGKTTIGANAVAQYLNENPNSQVLYMCYTNFAADSAQKSLQNQGFEPRQIIRITTNVKNKNWNTGVVGVKSDCSNLTPEEKRRLKACSVLLCTLHRSRLASKLRSNKTRVMVDEFSQVNPSMFFPQ
jgi:cytidylate kinase